MVPLTHLPCELYEMSCYCFVWAYLVVGYPDIPFQLTQACIVIPNVSVVDLLSKNLCKMVGTHIAVKYSLDVDNR